MGQKKKKDAKIKELSPEVLNKVKNALSAATISLLGYDPNYEYKILPSTKMSDLADVPEDILKLQETAIFLEQENADDMMKCRKYIYKIEKRVIKEAKDNGDYVHTQTLFHLIGKTKYGYVPSTLIITKYDWKNDTFFKSSFVTRLKGEKYVVLQRIDTSGQEHENSFLNFEGKLLEPNATQRYIPAGQAHQHKYSELVMKYHYNNLMTHNTGLNPIQAMFYKRAMKLDAQKEEPMKTCDDLLEKNISCLNISCIRECEENESLGSFYDYCQKLEAQMLDTLKKTDSTIKPHYTRLPFYKIKENIGYIRDKDKPKAQVEATEQVETKTQTKIEEKSEEKPHKKRYHFDDSRDEYELWLKGEGRKYEKYVKCPNDREKGI